MEKLLTFGLKNGKLENILNVENGLGCNCICPYCKGPLIAKANKTEVNFKRKPHFAHYKEIECPNAYESALHLLAKEVLIESKILQLPDFHYDYNPKNSYSNFQKLEIITFDILNDEVIIPTEKGNLFADILAIKNKKSIIIEFAKSHFVDDEKKQKIILSNYSAIEINLKDQELDRDLLRSFFQEKSQNIYWIHNKKMEVIYSDHLDFQKKLNLDLKWKENQNQINQETYLEEKRKSNNLIFDVTDGYIYTCPLSDQRKKQFINSSYFQIPLLKNIYEGLPWDREIHGSIHIEFYIKINDKKIELPNSGSDQDHKKFSTLYKGLKLIKEFEKISYTEHCRKCKYHEKEVKVGNKDFLICSFKSKQ